MIEWTPSQQLAFIDTKSNLLVSAGAGSGKTAVLTERIYRFIKEGTPIKSFLVVTFTKLAAMEMKNRIREKLLADEELKDRASEIENAHIDTFDAYLQYLVKKYSFHLGISADLKVIDISILTILAKKYIRQIVETEILEGNKDYTDMVKFFCTRNIDNVLDIIFEIYIKSTSQIDKEAFYMHCLDKNYFLNLIDKTAEDEYRRIISILKEGYKFANDIEDKEKAEQAFAYFETLLKAKDYDDLYEKVKYCEENNIILPDRNKEFPTIGLIKDLVNFKMSNGTRKQNIDDFLKSFRFVEPLINVAKKVDLLLETYKKKHNAYTFNDLSIMALKLLNDKKIAQENRDEFKYILVDEYQDTSDIQEAIINALSNNNVFMVGDIKQSIYGFRNANCDIFQDKYDRYRNNVGGKLICLNENHRSRKELVDFTNEMYGKLMIKENTVINYADGHHFTFGKKDYNKHLDEKENYNIKFYSYLYKKANECGEIEANIIADDIINKINSHYKVYDKKVGLRDATFSDFAILARNGNDFDDFQKIFSSKKIPLKVVKKIDIKKDKILTITKNLLKLFNYIKDELYDDEFVLAYMSIARSFLVRMDDETLHKIVDNKIISTTDIYLKIKKIVDTNQNSSNFTILSTLLNSFDTYSKITTIKQFTKNTHILESLLQKAKEMDNIGYNTKEMLQYFEDIEEFDLKIEISNQESVVDSVKILTIHGSKGLEFPIVYLAELSHEFNMKDAQKQFVVDDKYGIIFPELEGNYVSLIRSLYQYNCTHSTREEELRLLYVAMTRSKERLIGLVGYKKSGLKEVEFDNVKNYSQYLLLADIYQARNSEYVFKNEELSLKTPQNEDKTFEFDNISVKKQEIISRRASKVITSPIDENTLEFGNQLHYLLEIVDYDSKDTSFIKDQRMRKYVDNVINSPVFNGVKASQIKHEFSFYDEVNEIHGYIDALIIKDDEIIIVDFKSKNIDDEGYNKQLKIYESYIKRLSNKKIKTVLISAVKGEYRYVS